MEREDVPLLVGRDAELAVVDARISAVAGGAGLATVVVGGPGLGKSALLREVEHRWAPGTVLRATGFESEADLAFVTLRDLLRPVMDRAERLPAPQAQALRTALAMGAAEEANRLAVFAGALGLIEDVCAAGPLLVSIDDLHWADRSSIDVLRYVMRRVPPGCLVVGARNDAPLRPLDLAVEELVLGPLELASSMELLRGLGPLAPQVARRVAAECSGNPCALEITHRLLTDRQRWGVAPLDVITGDALRGTVDRQLRQFTPATIDALGIAALSLGSTALRAVLRTLGGSVEALAEPIARGVIVENDGAFRFASPVLRSVAADALTPDRRSEVLAVLAEHERDPERRAWLTALAARGDDEEAATALMSLGLRYAHAGGAASALEAFRAAVAISAPAQRATRCLQVAETALSAGRFDLAAPMAAEVRSDPHATEDTCFRAELVEARLRAASGEASAGRLLHEAALRLDEIDPAAAEDLRMWAAMSTFTRGDVATARQWQRQVDAVARTRTSSGGTSASSTAAAAAAGLLGVMLDVFSGDLRGVDDAVALHAAGNGMRAYEDRSVWAATTLAQVLVWSNRLVAAQRHLDLSIEASRRSGDLTALPFLLSIDADLRYRTGDWDRAIASAGEAVEVARASDNMVLLTFALIMGARGGAVRGDVGACELLEREGSELAERLGLGSIAVYAAATRGRCALFDGRLGDARTALVEATRRLDAAEGGNPWVTDHLADLVEVAHALCDLALLRDTARRLRSLTPLDPLSEAMVFRVEALLVEADDPGSAAVHLERSLRALADVQAALEVARAHAHLARVRVVLGQGALAAEHRRRADTLLDALGVRRVPSATDAAMTLSGGAALRRASPRERHVAELVASGRSNKEIAAELAISVKTVEHHLRQLFRDVGVTSRTQLAAVVLDERRRI